MNFKKWGNLIKAIFIFQFVFGVLICQGQSNPEKHKRGMDRLSFLSGTWTRVNFKKLRDGSFEELKAADINAIDSSSTSKFTAIFKGNYFRTEAKIQFGFSMTIGYDQWRDKYVLVSFEDGPGLIDIYQGDFDANGDLVISNFEAGTHYVQNGIKYYNRMIFTNFSAGKFTWYIEGSTDGSNWIKLARYDLVKQAKP